MSGKRIYKSFVKAYATGSYVLNSNTKEGESAGIPIIAMTANAFSSDVQACLDAGMNAHLSKPLEIELLKQTMKSVSRPHKEQYE